MTNSLDFKWLCHEWFHHVHEGHSIGELGTIVRRLYGFSGSFPGDVRGESGHRKLASATGRTRFHNGHVADLSAELCQLGRSMTLNSDMLINQFLRNMMCSIIDDALFHVIMTFVFD